jgi:hypothetical protein
MGHLLMSGKARSHHKTPNPSYVDELVFAIEFRKLLRLNDSQSYVQGEMFRIRREMNRGDASQDEIKIRQHCIHGSRSST